MTRRAVALAAAAALLAAARGLCGAPAAAHAPIVLYLSDRPGEDAWLASFTEGLAADAETAPALVLHRALPDFDESLLDELSASYSPAAVVSRQPLTPAAVRALEARGIPVVLLEASKGNGASGASWSQYARRELLPPPPPEVSREAAAAAARARRALSGAAPAGPSRAGPRESARAHLEFGDDRAAERNFEKLLASSPDDPEALRSLVALRRRELRWWPALEAARRLAAAPGLSPARRAEAALAVAGLAEQLGEPAAAAREYGRALALAPGSRAALAGMARARRERPEEALRYAARAAAGGSASPADLRLLGEIHSDLGDAAAARRALTRALSAAPGDLETLSLLVLVEKDRPAQAAAYAAMAQAVAEEEPLWRRADAFRISARLWREAGDGNRADASYRRALGVDPDHLGSLRELLDLRGERPSQPGDAVAPWASDEVERGMSEAAVLRALDADGADLDALRRLIELRIAQGRLKESAALTKRFLGAVPDAPSWMRASAYRLVSRLAWDSGDPFPAWFAARGADRWALEEVRLRMREPGGGLEYQSAEVEAAAARARLGDPEGAERRFKRVLSVFPEDSHALFELFRLLSGGGRRSEALALSGRLDKALTAAVPKRRARFLAEKGELLLAGRDEAAAREALLASLRLDPSGPALLMLQRLAAARRDFAEALSYAERLEAAEAGAPPSRRAPALVEKARLQLELKDEAGAERSLRAALSLSADGPVLAQLLHLTASQRRFSEALELAERLERASAAASPAERALLFVEKARLQLELKDDAGAERSLRESLSLSAGGPALPLLLQQALSRSRFSEALDLAERIAAGDAQAPPAQRAVHRYQKARIQLALKDEAGAEESLRSSLSLAVDGPALVSMLELTSAQGRWAEALGFAQRLEAENAKAPARDRAAALVRKAQIQLRLKDEAGARRSLEQALLLEPGGAALPMLRHLEAAP